MPERRLLHDSLLAAAELEPGKEALVVDGKRYSYSELLDTSLRLASALQDLGLERGDRVVVFTDNSLFCVASIFGTLLAGGVFVVVNPQTKEDKLAYILQDSDAAILVTEGSIARVASRAGRGRALAQSDDLRRASREDRRDGRLRRPRYRRRAGSTLCGHDPAGPGRAHLHVREHGSPQGRDDDPPEHGLRGGERRRVPPPRVGGSHPGHAPTCVRLRPVPAADERTHGWDTPPRALLRLPRSGPQAARGGAGDSLPRSADRLLDAPVHARAEPTRLPECPARDEHSRSASSELPRAPFTRSSRTRSSSACTGSPSASG